MYLLGHTIALHISVFLPRPAQKVPPRHCLVCCLVPPPQVLLQKLQDPQSDQTIYKYNKSENYNKRTVMANLLGTFEYFTIYILSINTILFKRP